MPGADSKCVLHLADEGCAFNFIGDVWAINWNCAHDAINGICTIRRHDTDDDVLSVDSSCAHAVDDVHAVTVECASIDGMSHTVLE